MQRTYVSDEKGGPALTHSWHSGRGWAQPFDPYSAAGQPAVGSCRSTQTYTFQIQDIELKVLQGDRGEL